MSLISWFNNPNQLESVTFWFDFSGAFVEFGVAITVAIIAHNEFGKKREKKLEKYVAVFAGIAAFLVLTTAFLNHHVSILRKLESNAKDIEISEAKTASSNALSKASSLEVRISPKPLSERILTILGQIDPGILPALKSGRLVDCSGFIQQSQKEALDRLFSEPGASAFIRINPHEASSGISENGPTSYVNFTILTNIIESP